MGFEDLAKLKDTIKERMSQEFGQMTAMKLKRDVLDALDKLYDFELPVKLVEAEFNGIWKALTNEMKRAAKSFADENTTEEDARKEYKAIAERRVRLGLVLGTLGEKEGIQVNEQELQQALMNRMRQFPGQEKQVMDYYRKNPAALVELRGPIFEQKVVDLIVSRGQGGREEGRQGRPAEDDRGRAGPARDLIALRRPDLNRSGRPWGGRFRQSTDELSRHDPRVEVARGEKVEMAAAGILVDGDLGG